MTSRKGKRLMDSKTPRENFLLRYNLRNQLLKSKTLKVCAKMSLKLLMEIFKKAVQYLKDLKTYKKNIKITNMFFS